MSFVLYQMPASLCLTQYVSSVLWCVHLHDTVYAICPVMRPSAWHSICDLSDTLYATCPTMPASLSMTQYVPSVLWCVHLHDTVYAICPVIHPSIPLTQYMPYVPRCLHLSAWHSVCHLSSDVSICMAKCVPYIQWCLHVPDRVCANLPSDVSIPLPDKVCVISPVMHHPSAWHSTCHLLSDASIYLTQYMPSFQQGPHLHDTVHVYVSVVKWCTDLYDTIVAYAGLCVQLIYLYDPVCLLADDEVPCNNIHLNPLCMHICLYMHSKQYMISNQNAAHISGLDGTC